MAVLRHGRPDQSSTAKVAGLLGNLAMHEPLRATMRRAGVFHPMAAKLDAVEEKDGAEGSLVGGGSLPPFARFQGLTMVAMLYGEDSTDNEASALLSRHDVSRLAVAALHAALEGRECAELSVGGVAPVRPNLSSVLPQARGHQSLTPRRLCTGYSMIKQSQLNDVNHSFTPHVRALNRLFHIAPYYGSLDTTENNNNYNTYLCMYLV